MTPKQEQFARLYVETGNASEAYRQAYNADNMKPETVTNEAYKLLQDPDISAMVDGLKAEARQRHAVTVDDLLHELEQARAAALAAPTPQSSAAVSATMGKAKMLGLLVDKAEIKAEAEIQEKPQSRIDPIFDSLTEEEKKLSPNGKNNYQTALETAKKIKTDMKIVPVKTLQDAIDYLKKNK